MARAGSDDAGGDSNPSAANITRKEDALASLEKSAAPAVKYSPPKMASPTSNYDYVTRALAAQPATSSSAQGAAPAAQASTGTGQDVPKAADLMALKGMNFLSTPAAFNAYANTLDGWSRYLQIMNSQSEFVMTIDRIGDDGIPTFKPLTDAAGNKISQGNYALNKAQIDRLVAQTTIDTINATGQFQDPVTGKMVKTPTAILQAAQSDQYKAQAELTKQEALKTIAETAYISGAQTNLTNNQANLVTAQTTYTNEQQRELARRYELDRQNALAQAVADPRRSVEAAMMMQLYGANQGGMPVGTGGYSAQGLAAQAPQYGAPGTVAQGFAGGQATQAQAMQAGQGGVTQAAVMPSVAAQGQAPAAWPSPTGQVPSTDAANGVGGYSAAQLAQARQNAAYVVNPNLAAALQGKYVPAAGNKSGSYGQVTTVAGAAPSGGNYGKINPVSYRNMDADTKARYGSLALANQGMSEQDLAKRQAVALPGSSLTGSSRL